MLLKPEVAETQLYRGVPSHDLHIACIWKVMPMERVVGNQVDIHSLCMNGSQENKSMLKAPVWYSNIGILILQIKEWMLREVK